MKKYIHILVNIFVFSFLFLIQGIYGYLYDITNPIQNSFTISNKTSYTVIHQTMDLDGVNYTEVARDENHDITIGTEISPEVMHFPGFTSPSKQTVVLNSWNNTVITYSYTRNQYNLTINDSQYVSTQTPTGRYYYGTTITLTAADDDGQGHPFAKWSDGSDSNPYSFQLLDDTVIQPIYSTSYQVTFVPDNGETIPSRTVIENEKVGALPTVIKETCPANTTGNSYYERGCTEGYEFKGWFLEPTFETEVNADFVPTEDTTLYAKWHKVFYGNQGPETFTGNNYINSGVQLFTEENNDRDFLVTFKIDVNDGYPTDRGTIFTCMNEKAEPFPGVHFFYQNNKYTMNVNVQGNKIKNTETGYQTGQKVTLKRENGLIYYKYDDGDFIYINDLSSFSNYFNNYATFGAGTNSQGNPYRYFRGELSDLSVEVFESHEYTIHYDPNGGEGMMVDQSVKENKTVNLNANTYTNSSKIFAGWNTERDGSGTAYNNKQSVSGLGETGEVITLYAQWADVVEYSIHYEANGGTGSMQDQVLYVNDDPTPLTTSTFTKDGYIFVGWNTEANGNGTTYLDKQKVQNLTDIPNNVITLYAQYLKPLYELSGDTVFDGTADTFLDTGINLYKQETIDKDFEIRFTVKAVGATNDFGNQATIINCKDESNPKWPGFNVRFPKNSNASFAPAYKWSNNTGSGSTNGTYISTSQLPVEMIFRRINGKVTVQYKFTNSETEMMSMFNQSSWTLDAYFADNISFGGIYDADHQPDRFFTGTVSDIQIYIED